MTRGSVVRIQFSFWGGGGGKKEDALAGNSKSVKQCRIGKLAAMTLRQ